MRIKKGVKVEGIRDPIFHAILKIDDLYLSYGVKGGVVLTSIMDGVHMKGSRHYTGDAVDIRTWDLPDVVTPLQASDTIRDSLDTGYDVVLEKDHIHVEWDPKGGEKWNGN